MGLSLKQAFDSEVVFQFPIDRIISSSGDTPTPPHRSYSRCARAISTHTTRVYAKIVDKMTENLARYLEALLGAV